MDFSYVGPTYITLPVIFSKVKESTVSKPEDLRFSDDGDYRRSSR